MHLPAEFFVNLANYETIIHDTLKEFVEAFKNEFWLTGSFRLDAGHEPLTHLGDIVNISCCLTKHYLYFTLP